MIFTLLFNFVSGSRTLLSHPRLVMLITFKLPTFFSAVEAASEAAENIAITAAAAQGVADKGGGCEN